MDTSKTPGGSIIPIETQAKILPVCADGAFAQGPAGSPLPGGVAPGGLDPYGPVTPAPGAEPAPPAPPVDYTQAPVPPTQQTLSPLPQFLLARRQSVLRGSRRSDESRVGNEGVSTCRIGG